MYRVLFLILLLSACIPESLQQAKSNRSETYSNPLLSHSLDSSCIAIATE